jgi:hypothetical protein
MLKRIAFGMMFAFLLFSTLISSFDIPSVRSAENDWWYSAWPYRRQVSITETTGLNLTFYPIEVSFIHNGHVKTDGSDIRVVDDSTEIPYHITSKNSSWATVMFQTNLTSLSTKNIYIYYGNTQATAQSYPLVPLTFYGGPKQGNATIDNRIFIGWDNVAWGVQPGYYIVGGNLVYIDNNQVVLWDDFRLDFNNNGVFEENEDLLTDFDLWKGGIGRSLVDLGNYVLRSYGLGDFQDYVQTPIFVDLIFADARLRVFKGQNLVETVQADRLQMESTSWDFAEHQDGMEENIIDGLNTNGPASDPLWSIMYNSSVNPGWMAFRNSMTGYVIGAIGFNTDPDYLFRFWAKEAHAWDRLIMFDYTTNETQDPYDQPADCRIYWYADGTNGYTEINRTAAMLSSPPTTSMPTEEAVPEFPSFLVLPLFMIATLMVIIVLRRRHSALSG